MMKQKFLNRNSSYYSKCFSTSSYLSIHKQIIARLNNTTTIASKSNTQSAQSF